MTFPKLDSSSLQISQQFLVFQIFLPISSSFNFLLSVQDVKKTKRRLLFSTAFKSIESNPLHAQIPLINLHRGEWMNLCFDVDNYVKYLFHESFMSLDRIEMSPSFSIRRIFTLRRCPPGTIDDGSNCGYLPPGVTMSDPIPSSCSFPVTVRASTQIYWAEKTEYLLSAASIPTGSSFSATSTLASSSASSSTHPSSQRLTPPRSSHVISAAPKVPQQIHPPPQHASRIPSSSQKKVSIIAPPSSARPKQSASQRAASEPKLLVRNNSSHSIASSSASSSSSKQTPSTSSSQPPRQQSPSLAPSSLPSKPLSSPSSASSSTSSSTRLHQNQSSQPLHSSSSIPAEQRPNSSQRKDSLSSQKENPANESSSSNSLTGNLNEWTTQISEDGSEIVITIGQEEPEVQQSCDEFADVSDLQEKGEDSILDQSCMKSEGSAKAKESKSGSDENENENENESIDNASNEDDEGDGDGDGDDDGGDDSDSDDDPDASFHPSYPPPKSAGSVSFARPSSSSLASYSPANNSNLGFSVSSSPIPSPLLADGSSANSLEIGSSFSADTAEHPLSLLSDPFLRATSSGGLAAEVEEALLEASRLLKSRYPSTPLAASSSLQAPLDGNSNDGKGEEGERTGSLRGDREKTGERPNSRMLRRKSWVMDGTELREGEMSTLRERDGAEEENEEEDDDEEEGDDDDEDDDDNEEDEGDDGEKNNSFNDSCEVARVKCKESDATDGDGEIKDEKAIEEAEREENYENNNVQNGTEESSELSLSLLERKKEELRRLEEEAVALYGTSILNETSASSAEDNAANDAYEQTQHEEGNEGNISSSHADEEGSCETHQLIQTIGAQTDRQSRPRHNLPSFNATIAHLPSLKQKQNDSMGVTTQRRHDTAPGQPRKMKWVVGEGHQVNKSDDEKQMNDNTQRGGEENINSDDPYQEQDSGDEEKGEDDEEILYENEEQDDLDNVELLRDPETGLLYDAKTGHERHLPEILYCREIDKESKAVEIIMELLESNDSILCVVRSKRDNTFTRYLQLAGLSTTSSFTMPPNKNTIIIVSNIDPDDLKCQFFTAAIFVDLIFSPEEASLYSQISSKKIFFFANDVDGEQAEIVCNNLSKLGGKIDNNVESAIIRWKRRFWKGSYNFEPKKTTESTERGDLFSEIIQNSSDREKDHNEDAEDSGDEHDHIPFLLTSLNRMASYQTSMDVQPQSASDECEEFEDEDDSSSFLTAENEQSSLLLSLIKNDEEEDDIREIDENAEHFQIESKNTTKNLQEQLPSTSSTSNTSHVNDFHCEADASSDKCCSSQISACAKPINTSSFLSTTFNQPISNDPPKPHSNSRKKTKKSAKAASQSVHPMYQRLHHTFVSVMRDILPYSEEEEQKSEETNNTNRKDSSTLEIKEMKQEKMSEKEKIKNTNSKKKEINMNESDSHDESSEENNEISDYSDDFEYSHTFPSDTFNKSHFSECKEEEAYFEGDSYESCQKSEVMEKDEVNREDFEMTDDETAKLLADLTMNAHVSEGEVMDMEKDEDDNILDYMDDSFVALTNEMEKIEIH
eukprot:MONOS_6541.1-p1 / transcript=MONOS_6541.1 / gene=MONOS_6541 / organism=Monocercomonoides_exilis_PA203 / gene_product=Uncharacterized protein C3orf67-like protein / transcript_product=Uncharacterized protein C3orf67-like protein / location=Mono_scaffold00207:59926-65945(+) / protein_length=1549 / sequence_SO=supercontig / SO=protein_coding / is_pseudo=false